MLNNYGAHCIDTVLYMIEQKVARLSCIKDVVATAGDADDVVKVLFRTEGGVTIDININQAAAIAQPEWVLYGSTGAIISEAGPDGKKQFRMRYYDPEAVPPLVASQELTAANRKYSNDVPMPWVEEIVPLDGSYAITFYDKVYEFYGEDRAPYVPVKDTLYVMELIGRCHADADA